jgi:hypothetical protein
MEAILMAFIFRFTLRRVMILIAILVLLLYVGRWLFQEEYGITTFDCGARGKIIITAASSWEISQPVYYQIVTDGKIVVQKSTFYYAYPGENMRFSIVTAENGNLVGVVSDRDCGHVVLILHDFGTCESWPAIFYVGDSEDVKKRLVDAFNRLKAENLGLRMSMIE